MFFLFFLSIVGGFSPCTHQTDITVSILRTIKTFCASSNKGKETKIKENTLKQCGFRAAMVNMLKRGFFWEQGTSDAAPRSRHQKKALYFQTNYQRCRTLPGHRRVGSLLGFWRRPLQGGLRHLQLRRVPLSRVLTFWCLRTFVCYDWSS